MGPTSDLVQLPNSHAMDAWELWRANSNDLPEKPNVVVLKDKPRSGVYRLRGAGPHGEDVIAKRGRAEKISKEWSIYTEWLSRLPVQGVRCFRHVQHADSDLAWIFLEDAAGSSYRRGNARHRALLARWLARLHSTAVSEPGRGELPERGAEFYRQCLSDLCVTLDERLAEPAFAKDHRKVIRRVRDTATRLSERWMLIEDVCNSVPHTFVHGDLLPKNMCVSTDGSVSRLLIFDWELGGWGPPILDLVQSGDTRDSWAAPNLSVYHEAIRGVWPELPLEVLRRGASVARLLHWVLWSYGDSKSLDGPWPEHPLIKLATYEAEITRVMRELRWDQEV